MPRIRKQNQLLSERPKCYSFFPEILLQWMSLEGHHCQIEVPKFRKKDLTRWTKKSARTILLFNSITVSKK